MVNVNFGGRALRAGLVASFLASAMLVSPAGAMERVFFFGDSTTETGNACLLPFLPGDPFDTGGDLVRECRDARYFLGRTTQGPVLSEVLASNLAGTPLIGEPPHGILGESIALPFFPDTMAVGSAPPAALALFEFSGTPIGIPPETAAKIFRGGANLSLAGAVTENLATEVTAFLALSGIPTVLGEDIPNVLQPGKDDLYVVSIGGSDIRRPIEMGEEPDIGAGVSNIVSAIEALQAAVGARRFLVLRLPDVGLSLDLTDAQKAAATAATKQWNQTLDAGLATIDGPEVTRLDAFCLTEALIRFGRLNTRRSCLAGTDYPACRGVLLFDDIHATSAVHRSVGLAAQAALECRGEAPGSVELRRCVARFTSVRLWQRSLTPAGWLAINKCVGR